MKNKLTNYAVMAATVLAMVACSGTKKTEEKTEEVPEIVEVAEVTYTIDSVASEVFWKGEVAGVYGHHGLIEIKEGTVTASGDKITGGKVVIDMTTIQPTDSASYNEEHPATDLIGHLSTGDFFLVEEYPEATFVIKAHEGDKLTGDLTIRGTTKEYTATVTSLSTDEKGLSAKADLVFNRQDFGVSWVHYMKDMVLSDDIAIKLDIVAKP